MKKYIITLLLGFVFALNTAFTPDSLNVTPEWDSSTVAEITTVHKVEFEPATVNATVKWEEKSANLEQCIERQTSVDKEFVEQLKQLNSKLPDMTISPTQAKLEALEEEFGITSEDYTQSLQTQTMLTNSINLLTFVLAIGTIGFLVRNNKVKRTPDAWLKGFYGLTLIGSLFLLRFALISLTTVINPTYQIIQYLAYG